MLEDIVSVYRNIKSTRLCMDDKLNLFQNKWAYL
nr:MAG TPA: hypothetical protein [Caudoviricetes sp.]